VTFAGILGVKDILLQVKGTLEGLPDTQAIIDRRLDLVAEDLQGSLKPYYDTFKDRTISSPSDPTE
jgi:hypothetical protein